MNLALAKGSGIATYGHNLLANLTAMGADTQVLYGPATPRSPDPVLNEIALVDAGARQREKAGAARALRTLTARFGRTAYPVPITGEVIWPDGGLRKPAAGRLWSSTDLYNLANRAFKLYGTMTPVRFDPEGSGAARPDVVHWTCPMPAYAPDAVNIVTFHDIIPLRLPHATLDDKRGFHRLCQKVIERADHILAVSEHTRQDMIRVLGAPEHKITTTYQSVTLGEEERAMDDAEAARQVESLFSLDWKGYFLFFGAVEPKKNIRRLVEAYLGLRTSTPLVLVTGRSWLAEAEVTLINNAIEHETPDRTSGIRQLDYLPPELLNLIIRGARATLFPSLYEGFGLPILESMLRRTAVLTSTAGSLPEVAGDAAVFVDPASVESIRQGISTLDNDPDLRSDLEARGLARAAMFDEASHRNRLALAYRAGGVDLGTLSSPGMP